MVIDYLDPTPTYRLQQISHTLKTIHGVELPTNLSENKIQSLISETQHARDKLIEQSSFNSYLSNPEYIKSMLILEALRISLREVSPGRKKKAVQEAVDAPVSMEQQRLEFARKLELFGGHVIPASKTGKLSNEEKQQQEQRDLFIVALQTIANKLQHKDTPMAREAPLTTLERDIVKLMRHAEQAGMLDALTDKIKTRIVNKGVELYGPALLAQREELRSDPEIRRGDWEVEKEIEKEKEQPMDKKAKKSVKEGFNMGTGVAQIKSLFNTLVQKVPATGTFTRLILPALSKAPGGHEDWSPIMDGITMVVDAAMKKDKRAIEQTMAKIKELGQGLDREYFNYIYNNLADLNREIYNDKMAESQLKNKKKIKETDMIHSRREVTPEGNEFVKARLDAIKAGKKHFTVGGKTFQITGDTRDELAKVDEAVLGEMHDSLEFDVEVERDPHTDVKHYEYQASMARSELYRNAKYGMSMMNQIQVNEEVEPWIAGALTKAANYLDKIYHYLDYYKTFEPEQLPEELDGDMDLGETSGSITRQNLMMIVEYSTKLFEMIKPGDHLEGWVAMKLTTASECISSAKHYLDYKHFETHALDDHFSDGRAGKSRHIAEQALRRARVMEQQDLAQAETLLAAKDLSNQLQQTAEKIAKMSVEDLMPLVDVMREQFGPEAAQGFNDTVKASLESLLSTTSETKDQIDTSIETLQQGGVPGQQAEAPAPGVEPQGEQAPEAELEEPAEEPSPEEPLGRSKKDELAESWEDDWGSDQEDTDGNAYEMGYQAGVNGKSKLDNPFEGKDEFRAGEWEDGYNDGRKEAGLDESRRRIRKSSGNAYEMGYRAGVNEQNMVNNASKMRPDHEKMAQKLAVYFKTKRQPELLSGEFKTPQGQKYMKSIVKQWLSNEPGYTSPSDKDVNWTAMLLGQHLGIDMLSEAASGRAKKSELDEGRDDGNAYEMGYRAGVNDRSSDNPFEGKDEFRAGEWEDGYKDGRKEAGLDESRRRIRESSGNAYEMGYQAGVNGKSKLDNPFEGKDEFRAGEWEDGYNDGRKEEGLMESRQKCMECGTGYYEENKKGKMACSKCGAVMESKKKAKKVKESTMGMDVATRYKIMSRDRLDAMAKQGDTRARQELSKRGPAPDPSLAMKPSATGVSNPYEIASDDRLRGMAARGDKQAQAELDLRRQPMHEVVPPGAKAERFIRQNKEKFRKQYGDRAEEVLYATAWKQFGKKQESYKTNQTRLENVKKQVASLQASLNEHRQTWKQQLAEGTVVDPLNTGYGLEGEVVASKLAKAQQYQRQVETWLAAYRNRGIQQLQEQVATVREIRKIEQAKKQAPWGLAYRDKHGQQQQKFFESRDNAKLWRDLNAKDIQVVQMFGPRDFDKKIAKLRGTL